MVALAGAAVAPAPVRGEACTTGVVVRTAHANMRLSANIALDISSDCPSSTYDVIIQPYLDVGRRRILKPHSIHIASVTMRHQQRVLHIGRTAVKRAVRTGHRTGHRRATLVLVISGRDVTLDSPYPQTATSRFFRLAG